MTGTTTATNNTIKAQEGETMENTKKFYYGNEVSEYGKKNGYVDYRCFAKAFDAVLNNDLMSELENKGFWFELVGGLVDNSEEIEELEAQIEELEEKAGELEEGEELEAIEAQIEELEEEKSELEDAEGYPTAEVYQYYIVSDPAVKILEENNELVWYCEELDLYIWGVCHWGTSWDYVLTNIKIDW